LGNALAELQQPEAALAKYQRALALSDVLQYRSAFAACLKNAHPPADAPALRVLVAQAIAEAWIRPEELARFAIEWFGRDAELSAAIAEAGQPWSAETAGQVPSAALVETLSDDRLVKALLETTPITDPGLERFLTAARRGLLGLAMVGGNGDAGAVPPALYGSLARQCFINEFIFWCSSEELQCAMALRARLSIAIEAGEQLSAWWIVAVAAYFPLSSLPSATFLLEHRWPQPVADLLAQHISEPLQERHYRSSIPRLSAIDGGVSRAVQQQYEESPYPRWIALPPPGRPVSLATYLRHHFPDAALPVHQGSGIDILVAGCGTGRESIQFAQQFESARILAIDLSLASLGYAKRKSVELDLPDIEYAQGDILALDSIGRTFDLIASVGVLHHLAAPLDGWRKLVALVRPGGYMLLGLYSELARRSVVAARALIRERGYADTADGIRQCRQHLLSSDDPILQEVTTFRDFFAMSECRDLLFNVQEQRFTLPQIKAALERLGLEFVGFFLERAVVRRYDQLFPGDPAGTHLDRWNAFEHEYPLTFAGMYLFVVRRA
jgi:SAM-dependent methyltransferase